MTTVCPRANSNPVIVRAWQDYDKSIVAVDSGAIESLSLSAMEEDILGENEIQALRGKSLEEAIEFLLALNSINYQYWSFDRENNFIRYTHNNKVGAIAAFEGFSRLYHDKVKRSPQGSRVKLADIDKYFGAIPNSSERCQILNESLDPTRSREAKRQILEYIESQGCIDTQLAHSVALIMPQSFRDEYLKKIQLSLYEIFLAAKGRGYPDLECHLTVAADYQIPKVLEAMGVLKYSPSLAKKIDTLQLIEENSDEERAIRAATIIACEEISSLHGISIPSLDRQIWLARNDYLHKKFHLTMTSKY